MLNMPLLITLEKANEIIKTREPEGRFLLKDELSWVVIYNNGGDVFVGDFETFESALKWFNTNK